MKNIIIVEDSYDIKQIDFKQNVHDQNEIFTLNFDICNFHGIPIILLYSNLI